jgi:hypothetical protein
MNRQLLHEVIRQWITHKLAQERRSALISDEQIEYELNGPWIKSPDLFEQA